MGQHHSNPTAINTQKHVEKEQEKIGTIKKGALHAELHLKAGPIPASTLDHEKAIAKKTHNTKLMERIVFAQNAKHFNH